MKISWGTGIVLALLSFIAFILFLVITMTTNKDLDHDLVVEDYYKKEVDFQDQLNREQNAGLLVENLRTEIIPEGLVVHFPEDLIPAEIKGTLFLYRPSNKQLDFQLPIALSSHKIVIPKDRLVAGRWNIEIDWSYETEFYFFKQEITY